MSLDIDGTVRELTQGQGYVILEGHFDAATVARARARLMELAGPMPQAPEPVARETLDTITTRAPGTDTLVNNVEVWNLIDKGEIFRTMAAAPEIDGNLFVDRGFEGLTPGDIIEVEVDEASDYDLWGARL